MKFISLYDTNIQNIYGFTYFKIQTEGAGGTEIEKYKKFREENTPRLRQKFYWLIDEIRLIEECHSQWKMEWEFVYVVVGMGMCLYKDEGRQGSVLETSSHMINTI